MASSEKLIPELLWRATSEYLKERFDQVKENYRPYTRLYRNKHGRLPCFVDDEDSLILKKDRSLDEANVNVVHDVIDVQQLREVSEFPPLTFRKGTFAKGYHT